MNQQNTQPPPVYDLIHNMDQAEKGYFKKYVAKLGKGENYTLLFNLLNQQKEYDKEKLTQKLKKKGVDILQLSVTFRHLYLLVLKCLRIYHETNYYKAQINNLLAETEILLNKGLKKQALRHLAKAEKMASEYHYYPALIEIQKLKVIQQVATVKKNLMEAVQISYTELNTSIDTLKEEIEFRRIKHLLLLCYRINYQDADHEYAELLKNISESELLNSKKAPQSFYSKYYKESARRLESLIYTDKEAAHLYYKEIIKIWEAHPHMIKAEPLLYKIIVSNYVGNSIFIKKVDDFDEQIKKIENIPTRFFRDEVELFQSKIFLEQLYFLNYRKLDTAYESINKNRTKYNLYQPHMNFSRLVMIQYNYMIACFLKSHFSEAISWLNLILYEKNADPQKNIRLFCRIMELILHYESKNFDLLDSLMTSVWRQRKKNSSFHDYTEIILAFFKKIIKTKTEKEKKKTFGTFIIDLQSFENKSPQPIGIEELLFWTRARYENRSIEEIYMEG